MTRLAFTVVGVAALLAWTTNGKLYDDPTSLPTTVFDYVVVGGGTAGNVIANRLSENSTVSVLVLEAGVSNDGVLASQIPLLGPSLAPSTPYDWNFTTTPQPGYLNRSIPYPRGKLLGGCSSLNYMVYTRGSIEDWDKYASLTGDPGWSWANMIPYVNKHERFVAPSSGITTIGKYSAEDHSTTGVVSVSLPAYSIPLDNLVVETTKRPNTEFPFNPDMSGGDVLGLGWAQATIGNGTRSSSATAYLSSQYINRPNLHVLINAQAIKLIQTGTVGVFPSFHEVQYSRRSGDPVYTVTALKEIILSAGALGTPQLLQLSGIGNAADLLPYNIKPLVPLPEVGKRLSDHVLLTNTYYVTGNSSYDDVFRDPVLLNDKIAEWTTNRTGPLANGITNHLGWARLPPTAPIFKTGIVDPASGPKSSHWEIIFSNLFAAQPVPTPSSGHFLTVFTNLISPTSRGSVTLSSSDAFAPPLINPNYLSSEFDIYTLREAVKTTRKVLTDPQGPWAQYVIGPWGELAGAGTDEEVERFVRRNAGSVWHPVGTASMSPKGATWGVVDPDLKVKKTEGLRVVDASVLPFLPNAHTQVPVYMVAERAADMIKALTTRR